MPSRGRTPLGPDEGEGWNGLVRRHVVSRTVRDSAAFLDATQGDDVGAPYSAPPAGDFLAAVGRDPGSLRIGFSTQSILGRSMDPECVAAVEAAAELLESLGHELVEIDLPIDREGLANAYVTIVAAGVGAMVDSTEQMTGRKPRSEDFEGATWFLRRPVTCCQPGTSSRAARGSPPPPGASAHSSQTRSTCTYRDPALPAGPGGRELPEPG